MKNVWRLWICILCSVLLISKWETDVFGAEETEQYYFFNSKMYTYEEMKTDLAHMESEYSGKLAVNVLNQTVDGRNLFHIIVGNKNAEKHILIIGSIHAREYLTSQLVMRQINELLKQAETGLQCKNVPVRDMLEHVAIHFVPMINPDGVTLCQLGIEGIQKPELRQKIYKIYEADKAVELSDYFLHWKSNAVGVDLNRNFDAKWDLYNDHVGHPSSDHFKGESPGSETETAALIELMNKYPFSRTISYHTQGKVIYWYFEQKGAFLEECRKFADLISRETGYSIDSDYKKLDPAGFKDWAIEKKKIPSLTIEVGTGKSPVESAQFSKIWEQNKGVCLAMLFDAYNS